jgi:hypothetical protein
VRWLAGVIRCRFDFDKQVALRLAEQLGATPTEALARFRCAVTSTIKPPLPTAAMLGETIVHGEDIRRPLGIHRDYPITTLTRLANYYQGSDLVGLAKGRIVGLRMQASDGPFAANRHPSCDIAEPAHLHIKQIRSASARRATWWARPSR